MAVLQENIQAYDFIQERISQVCTTEQLEAEEEDEMKQRSHHAELQEAYQYSSMPVRLGTMATRYRKLSASYSTAKMSSGPTHARPMNKSLPISKNIAEPS